MSAALEARIVALEARLAVVEARLTSGPVAVPSASGGSSTVADDSDLDGQYGDPIVKFGLKEKWWKAQPDANIGYHFSECPADYLDAMAKYLTACEIMAKREGTPETLKKAHWKAIDASRARGWAKRVREGRVVQREQQATGTDDDAESLPF